MPPLNVYVRGVEQVVGNLRRMDDKLKVGFVRGAKLAGLALQRESQRLVPVEFGVLRASAFTRHEGTGWDTQVNVGYTAAYALYVHEAAMKLKGLPRRPSPPHKGLYWDPQGRAQSKFLEAPARRMASTLRGIILAQMKLFS